MNSPFSFKSFWTQRPLGGGRFVEVGVDIDLAANEQLNEEKIAWAVEQLADDVVYDYLSVANEPEPDELVEEPYTQEEKLFDCE